MSDLVSVIEKNPALAKLLTPRLTQYIPHLPTPRQSAFLLLNCMEAFYGGAAGGGKSDALLMAALQWVDVPDYAALILRRTFADLALPGAIMERAEEWLTPTDAEWSAENKTWTFPSGATLTFGYLERESQKRRYDSSEFQFIGFDELTQFSNTQYTYLFSRLRRLSNSPIPIRMRSASNPDGVGHAWVKARFIDPVVRKKTGRVFIPAKISDNPHIDAESYIAGLNELDPTLRKQKLDGDWGAAEPGEKFEREWFEVVERAPTCRKIGRFWDLAGTKPSEKHKDPDWTRGLKAGMGTDGYLYIMDLASIRDTSGQVEILVSGTAADDGLGVRVYMPQDPGSAGKAVVDHYERRVLSGYAFKKLSISGSKWDRATPVSGAAEHGKIRLVRGDWNDDFLDEVCEFKQDGTHTHDDIVDVLSDAYNELAGKKSLQYEPDGMEDLFPI